MNSHREGQVYVQYRNRPNVTPDFTDYSQSFRIHITTHTLAQKSSKKGKWAIPRVWQELGQL